MITPGCIEAKPWDNTGAYCCCCFVVVFVVVALDCDCLRRPLWLRAPGGRRYNHIWLFLMGMCYYDGYYSFRKDNRLRFVDQISISHYHYRLMGLTHKKNKFKNSRAPPVSLCKHFLGIWVLVAARYVRIAYTRMYTALQTRALLIRPLLLWEEQPAANQYVLY